MQKPREFNFTNKDFDCIRKLVSAQTGIVLSEAKSDMVYSRLARRLRTLRFQQFSQYLDYLANNEKEEIVHFVNAITTNLTSFFREPHHFKFLADTLLPNIFSTKKEQKIRIWSAGCSTGEEPYSIAMVIKEAINRNKNWDIRILATDLDTNVVEKAKSGIYPLEKMTGVSEPRLKKYFHKSSSGDEVKIKEDLQEIITFKQLNLMHDWPIKGPFDFIFCRNVVIYFDKSTQRQLFERYANIIIDSGYLFIGHSESLFKVSDRYELLGNTIYRKTK